jgi:hypothetical protein
VVHDLPSNTQWVQGARHHKLAYLATTAACHLRCSSSGVLVVRCARGGVVRVVRYSRQCQGLAISHVGAGCHCNISSFQCIRLLTWLLCVLRGRGEVDTRLWGVQMHLDFESPCLLHHTACMLRCAARTHRCNRNVPHLITHRQRTVSCIVGDRSCCVCRGPCFALHCVTSTQSKRTTWQPVNHTQNIMCVLGAACVLISLPQCSTHAYPPSSCSTHSCSHRTHMSSRLGAGASQHQAQSFTHSAGASNTPPPTCFTQV